MILLMQIRFLISSQPAFRIILRNIGSLDRSSKADTGNESCTGFIFFYPFLFHDKNLALLLYILLSAAFAISYTLFHFSSELNTYPYDTVIESTYFLSTCSDDIPIASSFSPRISINTVHFQIDEKRLRICRFYDKILTVSGIQIQLFP